MKFSFLMAINRDNQYLTRAIDSVLSQTDPDFKFYIVANNCNDELWDYLSSLKDARLVVHRTYIGQLAFSLNYGLSLIRCGYVLRMDADDISLPDRLEKTKLALAEHKFPEILAGSTILIDGADKEIGHTKPPLAHKDIVKAFWRRNPICHPATVYRAEAILKLRGYNAGFVSEDYELWLRAHRSGNLRFAGSETVFLKYRVHGDQARGNPLAYAEIVGFLMREFLLTSNFSYIFGAGLSAAKYFIRKLRIA